MFLTSTLAMSRPYVPSSAGPAPARPVRLAPRALGDGAAAARHRVVLGNRFRRERIGRQRREVEARHVFRPHIVAAPVRRRLMRVALVEGRHGVARRLRRVVVDMAEGADGAHHGGALVIGEVGDHPKRLELLRVIRLEAPHDVLPLRHVQRPERTAAGLDGLRQIVQRSLARLRHQPVRHHAVSAGIARGREAPVARQQHVHQLSQHGRHRGRIGRHRYLVLPAVRPRMSQRWKNIASR